MYVEILPIEKEGQQMINRHERTESHHALCQRSYRLNREYPKNIKTTYKPTNNIKNILNFPNDKIKSEN